MKENKELLSRLITELLNVYGSSIRSIILFGSAARGTQTAESDIDIAVIYTEESRKQHERTLDVITDLNLEYDKIISVIMIDEAKFQMWGDIIPFYKNVKAEGIELWRAA